MTIGDHLCSFFAKSGYIMKMAIVLLPGKRFCLFVCLLQVQMLLKCIHDLLSFVGKIFKIEKSCFLVSLNSALPGHFGRRNGHATDFRIFQTNFFRKRKAIFLV